MTCRFKSRLYDKVPLRTGGGGGPAAAAEGAEEPALTAAGGAADGVAAALPVLEVPPVPLTVEAPALLVSPCFVGLVSAFLSC